MRKTYIILIVVLVIIWIVTLISCRTTRGFSTTFFETETSNPEKTIDSINIFDTINIPRDYEKWPNSIYVTSDSVMTYQYLYMTSKKDTTCIISITKVVGDSITYIKYRKE